MEQTDLKDQSQGKKPSDLKSDYVDTNKAGIEVAKEKSETVLRFSKGQSKQIRSPKPMSKFQALGTIDEAASDAGTTHVDMHSHKGDGSKREMQSNENAMNNAYEMEYENSLNKLETLNRSTLHENQSFSSE